MKPVMCRVPHYPEKGYYGDCLRAAVASMLEFDADDVPHFFHDGCDNETGSKRFEDFLKSHNLRAFRIGLDGGFSLETILKQMNDFNPDLHYLLFGSTAEFDHVVVCKNDKIVHNPAIGSGAPIVKCTSQNVWIIMVFVNE